MTCSAAILFHERAVKDFGVASRIIYLFEPRAKHILKACQHRTRDAGHPRRLIHLQEQEFCASVQGTRTCDASNDTSCSLPATEHADDAMEKIATTLHHMRLEFENIAQDAALASRHVPTTFVRVPCVAHADSLLHILLTENRINFVGAQPNVQQGAHARHASMPHDIVPHSCPDILPLILVTQDLGAIATAPERNRDLFKVSAAVPLHHGSRIADGQGALRSAMYDALRACGMVVDERTQQTSSWTSKTKPPLTRNRPRLKWRMSPASGASQIVAPIHFVAGLDVHDCEGSRAAVQETEWYTRQPIASPRDLACYLANNDRVTRSGVPRGVMLFISTPWCGHCVKILSSLKQLSQSAASFASTTAPLDIVRVDGVADLSAFPFLGNVSKAPSLVFLRFHSALTIQSNSSFPTCSYEYLRYRKWHSLQMAASYFETDFPTPALWSSSSLAEFLALTTDLVARTRSRR